MAATEDEAAIQLGQLKEAIRARVDQPGWQEVVGVLDLVQAEIDEGRPEVRKVRVQESTGRDRIAGVRLSGQTTSAELVGSEPFSARESLDMTVEAQRSHSLLQ